MKSCNCGRDGMDYMHHDAACPQGTAKKKEWDAWVAKHRTPDISQGPTVLDAPPATDTDRVSDSGVEPEGCPPNAPSGSAAQDRGSEPSGTQDAALVAPVGNASTEAPPQDPDEGATGFRRAQSAPSSAPSPREQRGPRQAGSVGSTPTGDCLGAGETGATANRFDSDPVSQPSVPSGGVSATREGAEEAGITRTATRASATTSTPPVSPVAHHPEPDEGRGVPQRVSAPSAEPSIALPSFPMRKDIRAIYLYLTSHGEPIHQGVFEDSPDLVRLLHTQIGNVIKAGTNGAANREVRTFPKVGKRG